MKKILFWAGLLLALWAVSYANDVSVIYSFSITESDTGTVRADTANTPSIDISGLSHVSFYSVLSAYPATASIDTNWGNDTFLIYLQYSPNNVTWNAGDTIALDTFLDNGSGWSWLMLDRDTTISGDYIRFKLVHRDSIGVGEVDSA